MTVLHIGDSPNASSAQSVAAHLNRLVERIANDEIAVIVTLHVDRDGRTGLRFYGAETYSTIDLMALHTAIALASTDVLDEIRGDFE